MTLRLVSSSIHFFITGNMGPEILFNMTPLIQRFPFSYSVKPLIIGAIERLIPLALTTRTTGVWVCAASSQEEASVPDIPVPS